MNAHRLVALAVAAALLAGCRSSPARWSSSPPTELDPDRWDRALCDLGAYPETLDSAALARARQDDLRAASTGLSSPGAFATVLGERKAFDARCAAWRAPSPTTDLVTLHRTTERTRSLREWSATTRARLGIADAAAP